MAHSITVLRVDHSDRGREILAGLADHLHLAAIGVDTAGYAQLWLSLDESKARETIVAALYETATDWADHIAVTGRNTEVRPIPSAKAAGHHARRPAA
jgi:hypothetical protein